MAAVLKIKDADGNWVDILALVGPKGDPGGGNLHTSASGTFLGTLEPGLGQGNGSYTVNFYRVGGLVTFDVQVTFTGGWASDTFDLVINIPEEYRPSKNIQISSVVSTPTVTQIWNLLSNVSDNLAVGTIPTGGSSYGWGTASDSYKSIPQNGAWTLRGEASSDYYEDTLTMRCVYVV